MSKHDSVTKRNRRPKSGKRADCTARTMAAVKQLEQRRERLNLLEKKLDMQLEEYETKLKMVDKNRADIRVKLLCEPMQYW